MLGARKSAILTPALQAHLQKMQGMPIRAIPFDVYGTLLDVHSAIAREGKELGARAEFRPRDWVAAEATRIYVGVVVARRVPQLPNPDRVRAGFPRAAAHGIEFGVCVIGCCWHTSSWTPFPEVAGALQSLQRQGLRMAALSPTAIRDAGKRIAGSRSEALEAVLFRRAAADLRRTVRSTNEAAPGPLQSRRSPLSRPTPGTPAVRRRSVFAPSGSTAPASLTNTTISHAARPSSAASAISLQA